MHLWRRCEGVPGARYQTDGSRPGGQYAFGGVERRPAPGGVIDPSPLVLGIPDPTAGRVGRPPRRHIVRHPYRAILSVGTPPPVVIELVQAVDTRRHVPGAANVEQRIRPAIIP